MATLRVGLRGFVLCLHTSCWDLKGPWKGGIERGVGVGVVWEVGGGGAVWGVRDRWGVRTGAVWEVGGGGWGEGENGGRREEKGKKEKAHSLFKGA